MAEYHTVEQGEHLSAIAENYGFYSVGTIWDHPNNASLKDQRKNPGVLLPGDQVFIPDKVSKKVDLSTGTSTTFRVKRDKLLIRFVVEDLFGVPLRNGKCEVHVEGRIDSKPTDDDGVIEISIKPGTQEASLVVTEKGSQLEGTELPIKIGHLDPVEERTGQIARLDNLGYFAGPLDDIDERQFTSAIEEFQSENGLTVTGICGDETQAKLKEVHGC